MVGGRAYSGVVGRKRLVEGTSAVASTATTSVRSSAQGSAVTATAAQQAPTQEQVGV